MVTIETGKLAKQADGAAVVKMGDTMLLATVCCKKEADENVDFMPLQVEYQEKYGAVGRFPGGFFKREARPSEYEILIVPSSFFPKAPSIGGTTNPAISKLKTQPSKLDSP